MEKLFRKQVKASIILPTYNRKNFLKRAINSVLMQEYMHWELIIVDDGSTDGTYQYLWQNYNQFTNIKILQIQNSGPAIAMNIGAKEATGEILFFLGSDDAIVNNHLSFRMKMHIQNPNTDIFHGGIKVIGDHWVVDKYNPGQKVNIYQCFAGGTFSVKKRVFHTLNGFKNLKFASDTDFIERAIKQFQVTKIDLPTTYIYYRDHDNTITKNILSD
ncbi:MAG TPA: glycosyltransferase [Oligoflexia bacterium]|nr:glycosyltransferase [Oligoflexia bacterium]HMR23840.1 glycosyltransferase [Oligoflexia bacterium]